MVTTELSWGQIQQWSWIHEMRRDPSRWVVVGDLLQSGAESKTAIESTVSGLLADYELDRWVVVDADAGRPRLHRRPFDVPVDWTDLRGSRAWAVHLVHSRFQRGHDEVHIGTRPIRLFGYTREDRRFSVVAAVSHLFADGAGLKGFARTLADRVEGREAPVAALSDVLSAQHAVRRRHNGQAPTTSDRFDPYYREFDWQSLEVRETGELVFRADEGEVVDGAGSMTAAGTMVAALGAAWRRCVETDADSELPLTLLHRLPSPMAGRPYMGPGDLNIVLPCPRLGTDVVEEGVKIWRSLIRESRRLQTDPPPEFGTTSWAVERDTFRRTLRLNVRTNASELAREQGAAQFAVRSSRAGTDPRAFVDVAFTRQALTIKWDLPRATAAQDRDTTFGQLALAGFLAAGVDRGEDT